MKRLRLVIQAAFTALTNGYVAGFARGKVLVLLAIMLPSVRTYCPFCKYLCLLGAVYGLFNPISVLRLHVDSQACMQCGACQKACKMDIRTFEQPNSPECIRCGVCITVCHRDAIRMTVKCSKKAGDTPAKEGAQE